LYDKNNIIGFCAVLHYPHPKVRNLKLCSRLVILPDYQGIGLGIKFLTFVAEKYKKEGFVFHIITSAKNMIIGLDKNEKWRFANYMVHRNEKGKLAGRKSLRLNNKTATFELR
jgi:GNAT superfamily N-acetyltransferase